MTILEIHDEQHAQRPTRAGAFRTAWDKGALAFHEGKGRDANPYTHSRFVAEWDNGWMHANNGGVTFHQNSNR